MTDPSRCAPSSAVRRAARLVALALALGAVSAAPSAWAACSADALCPGGASTCTIAGAHDLDRDCALDFGAKTVTVTGTLKSRASGGSFSIAAGALTLDGGKLRAGGSEDGDSGGGIEIEVPGAFRMIRTGPAIDADGFGGGGTVSIVAGSIDIRSGLPAISASGTGIEADGGLIMLEATGPVTLGGSIRATGGSGSSDGGTIEVSGSRMDVKRTVSVVGAGFLASITLQASPGGITLLSGATIDAHALSYSEFGETFAGSGGTITLEADGPVVLDGDISASGAEPDGDGGSVDVTSWTAEVRTSGTIDVAGNGADSTAGTVALDAGGEMIVGGHVLASATGAEGVGGDIDLYGEQGVRVAAGKALRATGGLAAGRVSTGGLGRLVMDGKIDVAGLSGAEGGTVVLGRHCTAWLDGTVLAGTTQGGAAGRISVEAYSIALGEHARIEATPCTQLPAGSSSCTQLTVRQGWPSIAPGAAVLPVAETVTDLAMSGCCGNATVEAGEGCDDGNLLHCDGCSPTCAAEADPACPSDGDECTSDCDATLGCTHAPLSGVACADDGSRCTEDRCTDGVCTHPAIACTDGVDCTTDGVCDPAAGCVFAPDDESCDDADACTEDRCDPALGCRYAAAPDATPCDDGDACTTHDACRDGTCSLFGPPLACDDGDACTRDACDPSLACTHRESARACGCSAGGSPLPAGTPCADGKTCTQGDRCDGAGTCVPGPSCDDGDPCTRDTCFGSLCVHDDTLCATSCAGRADGAPCSDGLECTTQSCQGGACVAAALDCGDADVCDGAGFCIEGMGCRSSEPPAADPFCPSLLDPPVLCRRAILPRGATGLPQPSGVSLVDAFGATTIDVKKVLEVCAPADDDGRHPEAPALEDHLAMPKTAMPAEVVPFAPRTGLAVSDAFGEHVLDVLGGGRILLPAVVSASGTPPASSPPDPDSRACYRVATSASVAPFVARTAVPIRDRYGAITADILRPLRLCRPANLAGQDPAAPAHATDLLCYKAAVTADTTNPPRQAVVVAASGGQAQLDLGRVEEVCFPAIVAGAP